MHSQKGTALVEFVLALPLLMLLLLGLIEMGRVTYFGIEVANAAHAGAQYGAIEQGTANMNEAAIRDGQNSIDNNLVAQGSYVCACWNPTTATATPSTPTAAACGLPCSTGGHIVTYAQMSVTGKINSLFNYAALGLPNQWQVTRVATIRVMSSGS